MIALETKMKKVDQIMTDSTMVKSCMPVYADLRGLSLEELSKSLSDSKAEIDMFYKFMCASVVSMVSDKANEVQL